MSYSGYRVRKYLRHFFLARNSQYLHSPFIYHLYNEVIKGKESNWNYSKGDQHIALVSKSSQKLEITDYGTGKNRTTSARIAVKNAGSSKKQGRLLHRLVQEFTPKIILELGTHVGISTSYLASTTSDSVVKTFEGASALQFLARDTHESLELHNIKYFIGDIKNTLPGFLKGDSAIDFVYLDANHTYEATITYFNMLLPHLHKESVLVLDDIYWSPGMTKAWKEICAHPYTTAAIDLYDVGLIFFRTEQEKQYFRLRF